MGINGAHHLHSIVFLVNFTEMANPFYPKRKSKG